MIPVLPQTAARGDDCLVVPHRFQNFDDNLVGWQQLDLTVQQKFACAVDECPMAIGKIVQSDVEERVDDGVRAHCVRGRAVGDCGQRRIPIQQLVSREVVVSVKDRLARYENVNHWVTRV
jgi:hypothetical protein